MSEYIVRETGYPGAVKQEVIGELVRCKDCRHNSLKRMSGNTFCDLGIGLYQLYDFCSMGERKDDASHPFADDVMMGGRADDE